MSAQPKILIFNGALAGQSGNTQAALDALTPHLSWAETQLISLVDRKPSQEELARLLAWTDAFVFSSGTYWDSWGSPLQELLERLTEFEGTEALLGKPCAVLITMHAVGGKEVLSRLQGVLNTMGLLLPPMTGFTYSLVGHLALETKSEFAEDFWRLDDLEIVAANLRVAMEAKARYLAWPVDRQDPSRRWL
jgi:multimeric flavodoxin WrbA